MTYEEFDSRARAVLADLATACQAAGRSPSEVTLLPVTKTHPSWAAEFAHRFGFASVGENRVQEAAEKRPLAPAPLKWELIGHLQSNKAKAALATFDRLQSVDSEKLLRLLDKAALDAGRTLRVLLQVNAGNDPAKFGIDLDLAPALLDTALTCKNLQVDGLMTIAPLSDDPDVARRTFANLRTLRDSLAPRSGLPLKELSMGMSGDFKLAIAEGSTLVRVGTALFGHRG